MNRTRLAATLLAASLPLLFAGGCANDGNNDDAEMKRTKLSGTAPPPSQKANRINAKDLIADAEAAEQRGEYSRALVNYEQLRSFPEASRPKDLDARIERVNQKMAKQ